MLAPLTAGGVETLSSVEEYPTIAITSGLVSLGEVLSGCDSVTLFVLPLIAAPCATHVPEQSREGAVVNASGAKAVIVCANIRARTRIDRSHMGLLDLLFLAAISL
ncbi:MAG: hypothetical protein JRM88_06645 [Nitrososphaerota archaeon]|jgi:hypothetical protein|nr:hypothetical protein [Nitrososphaerota archaeon]